MLMLLYLLTVLSPVRGPAPVAGSQGEATLHCRAELKAGAKARKCKVVIPSGSAVRSCTDTDRQAAHCDPAGTHAAWVVGTGPGKCRISAKQTKWDKLVYAKLSRSKDAPSTCDLYVGLR
jgi:transposase